MSVTADDTLIDSLRELSRALPTMRLGQLVANMATVARGPVAGAVWDVEDEELLRAIRWQLQQLDGSSAGTVDPETGQARGGINGASGFTSSQPPRPVS
jgi:hypothetical protein